MIGSGSWLKQGKDIKHIKPARFHRRKFSPVQTNYPTHDKEPLAIIDTLQTFEHDLIGTRFTVVTNHQSLQFLKQQKHLSNQQRRWLQFLSHFDFEIVYRLAVDNYLTGMLSRISENDSINTALDTHLEDTTIQQYDSDSKDEETPFPTERMGYIPSSQLTSPEAHNI